MSRIKNIVRNARGDMSQAAFARLLGKTQGLVSKYESGAVSPPSDTMEKCMEILEMNNGGDVNIDALVKRVRSELKAPQLAYVRKSIAALLDGVRASDKSSGL